MSLANTKASAAYTEALAATQQEWDSAVGFINSGETAGFPALVRQLNTTIFLLVRLDTKLASLEDKIQQIDQRVRNIEKEKSPSTGVSYKRELDEITNKLNNLKITGGQVSKEVGGNLRVIKNPYKILQDLKKK